ncbi:MAG: hypothetical protein RLZZ450_4111 [Pseudomonadota bacterium]
MTLRRSLLLCSALLVMFACGDDDPEQRPLVVVNVSADPAVAARLNWIGAQLYETDVDAGEPRVTHRFQIVSSGMANEKVVTLPFSFSVTQRDADSFVLSIAGYDTRAPDAQPIIERRTRVQFDPIRTQSVSIHLSAACLDRALACGTSSCDPQTGACVSSDPTKAPPAPSADAGPIDQPALDASADTGPVAVPGLDASVLDASITVNVPEAAVDAAVAELPPEVLPACPVQDACPLAAYPCVASDDRMGYACRGQLAAWPMPDRQPDAKQAPKYTVDEAQGTVLDEVTGLLWQRGNPALYDGCSGQLGAVRGDSCTHAEAEHYCSQLTLAGVRWRLPSKIELESTLSVASNQIVDETAFGDADIEFYWSSSPVLLPVCTDCSYAIGVVGGSPFTHDLGFKVRCVHSARNPNAPPSSRFVIDEQAREAHDRYTGLTWVLGTTIATLTEQEANDFCKRYGYRVPTLKEMFTLADLTRKEGAESRPTLIGGPDPLWTTTKVPVTGEPVLYSPSIASPFPHKPDEFPPHAACVR